MWTIAEYQPTGLFSLRPHTATTSGGKSLIVPTPFAIKMALVDAAIRTQGLERGRTLFPEIRDLRIAVRPPDRILVSKTFVRMLRIKEVGKEGKEAKNEAIARAKLAHEWPYQKYIGFREYVQFVGPLALAFQGMPSEELTPLLVQVNYLGKRGGFIQLWRLPEPASSLPDGFTILTEGIRDSFPLGVLQVVDDCGPRLTFEQANVYNPDEQIKVGHGRIFHHVVLPYQVVRSSKSFSYYERI